MWLGGTAWGVLPSVRVLHFPVDRELGLLVDLDRPNSAVEASDWWWMNPAAHYARYALARGNVKVAARTRLGLVLNPAECRDLAPFAELPSGVIEVVSLQTGLQFGTIGLHQWVAQAPPDDRTLARICALPGLRELHLDGAQLTNAGLAALEKVDSLERLCLIMSGLDREGIAHLGRLHSLEGLRVHTGAPMQREDLAPLAQLDGLEELNLGWYWLDARWPELFAALPPFTRLRRLLYFMPMVGGGGGREVLTDRTLATLARLPALESIQLYNGTCTAKGIAELTRLPKLAVLELPGSFVHSDAVLTEVAKMKSLRRLYVRRRGLSYKGKMRLKEVVPRCEVKVR